MNTDNSNKNVIKWLILFTPIGLVRIWTVSTWKLPTKVVLTLLILGYFGAIVFSIWYPLWKVQKELGLLGY